MLIHMLIHMWWFTCWFTADSHAYSHAVIHMLIHMLWFTCWFTADSHAVIHLLIHVLIHMLIHMLWFTCFDSHAYSHGVIYLLIHLLWFTCWFMCWFTCCDSHADSRADFVYRAVMPGVSTAVHGSSSDTLLEWALTIEYLWFCFCVLQLIICGIIVLSLKSVLYRHWYRCMQHLQLVDFSRWNALQQKLYRQKIQDTDRLKCILLYC